MEGFLQKWVNYVYGWCRRYFILHNGVLYYCTDRGQRNKGVIHLNIAQVIPHARNARRLIVDTGCTEVHLKADTPEECKRWLSVLKEQQANLAIDVGVKELRETEASEFDIHRRTLAETVGSIWNLQAQLESQVDLLSQTFKQNSQVQGILETGMQLKNAVAKLMSVVEEEQARIEKVFAAAKEKENLLRTEAEGIGEYAVRETHTFGTMRPSNGEEEEIEFKDALSHASEDMFYDAKEDASMAVLPLSQRPTRKCLPFLRNPNQKINLWKVLRETIGQELSKIAVPVYFNEPLSFLQRFSEDFTYSNLLVTASEKQNACLRLAYVACWIVSQYSFTVGRTMKPFNPVLGETFELETHGFRLVAEQVSHHPPVSAIFCEHAKFQSWGNTEVKSSFKGTYLLVEPTGEMHLRFKDWNEELTWTKPHTSVHNMIFGKVYVDHHGLLKILNHNTGDVCNLNIKKLGWFDKNPHSIEATVFDSYGIVRYSIRGNWDHALFIKDEVSGSETLAWEISKFPEGYENNYFFTEFSLQLNIPPEAFSEPICPTDSRNRPDQRALENGDIKQATLEKLRIEEKQRQSRKIRSEAGMLYSPRWFEEMRGEWRYKGGYWESKERGKFEECPDIF